MSSKQPLGSHRSLSGFSMLICFQRQTTFPSGELLCPPRRGGTGTHGEETQFLQLTLGYSQSLLPVICTSAKPGQAKPTGNYQVKLPRTASLICPICCHRGGDRGASSSVPPHGDLSLASDPFVNCQPGVTRTKRMVLQDAQCSASTQSKRVQEGTQGSPRTFSTPGHWGTCHSHFTEVHLAAPAFWASHSNKYCPLTRYRYTHYVSIYIYTYRVLCVRVPAIFPPCYHGIIITAQTCKKQNPSGNPI